LQRNIGRSVAALIDRDQILPSERPPSALLEVEIGRGGEILPRFAPPADLVADEVGMGGAVGDADVAVAFQVGELHDSAAAELRLQLLDEQGLADPVDCAGLGADGDDFCADCRVGLKNNKLIHSRKILYYT